MTCGVYGLIDPDSGAMRFVGSAWNIEGKFKAICEHPWKAGVSTGWEGRDVKVWLISLYRDEKKPSLQILRKCDEHKFKEVFAEYVEIYKLTGEADLNVQNIARSP